MATKGRGEAEEMGTSEYEEQGTSESQSSKCVLETSVLPPHMHCNLFMQYSHLLLVCMQLPHQRQ